MNGILKRKQFLSLIITGALCISLTGCEQKVEEEPVIVVADEEPGYVYSLTEVKRGYVALTKDFNCRYEQTKEQTVAFPEGGKKIEKIYVREGDYVKQGDILAEVSIGSLDEEIAALEYKMKKEALQKQYLDIHEEFDLRGSYYALAYGSKCEEEDVEEQEERDADIKESYQYQREDLSDEAEFDAAELAKLKKELAGSRIYASMSGMVYSVKSNLEGTISKKDEVIMTIIDGNNGVFAMEEPEYADRFTKDEILDMDVAYGSAKGLYQVVPYNMENWGEKQYFSIFDGPENDGIEMDTMGTISVTLDDRENVLMLPNTCVFDADGKNYVYILDENNMKTVCWIEIGLEGDDYTEIVSGLKEGDTVVRR